MSGVKQKVSGSFTICMYAEAHCQIASNLQAVAIQWDNPWAVM